MAKAQDTIWFGNQATQIKFQGREHYWYVFTENSQHVKDEQVFLYRYIYIIQSFLDDN